MLKKMISKVLFLNSSFIDTAFLKSARFAGKSIGKGLMPNIWKNG